MLDSLVLILPVFMILGLGIVLDIFHVLPKQTGSIIGAYVLYVALPLLLVHILAGSSLADITRGGFWAAMIGAQFLMYALGYCGELFLGKRGHGPAAVMGLACSGSNMAFVGLPVVMSLMPGNHEALIAAGLTVITPNVVFIPCQIQMEYLKQAGDGGTGTGTMLRLLKSVLLNSLVISTVVGLLLGATGIGLWTPLDKVASMVGNTTAPCMLLALGLDLRDKLKVALSGNGGRGLPRYASATLVKLIIHPIVAWILLAAFGVTGPWLTVGVLMSGTATALVGYVLADIYGHAPEEVAMIAVLTNVLNLFSLAVLASVLRSQGLL